MKNKGMFLETIINKTNDYYFRKNIAFVQKRFTKVHISKIVNNKVKGFLGNKNYVDYFGFVKGQHFEFEAKTCKEKKFYFKQIPDHQLKFLIKIYELGSVSFFVFYFSLPNKFYYISITTIIKWKQEGKKYFDEEMAKKKGQEIIISYPGILNYINLIIFSH